MIIEIICFCGAVFTVNSNYEKNTSELRCHCCEGTFPENTRSDIIKMLSSYDDLKEKFDTYNDRIGNEKEQISFKVYDSRPDNA